MAQLNQSSATSQAMRAHCSTRSARAGATAPRSSSRPSCRSAAIRPKTCCCARHSSTPARRELARTRRAKCSGTTAIVGFPEHERRPRYNAAAVLRDGRVAAVYRKQHLPNYTVFDEDRYFEPGRDAVRVRRRRRSLRHRHLRGLLVPRAGAAIARGGRASSSSCRTARRITRGSRRARIAQVDARARETRRAVRLRESRRRPGRARVRRRVVRHGCRRRDRAAAARVARDVGRRARSTARRRTACAARSTTRSSRTSTRRW